MQQRHGLTTPLFLSDMSSKQQALAYLLAEERFLVESHIDELEAEVEETIFYAAPHPSWHYYGKLSAVADFI